MTADLPPEVRADIHAAVDGVLFDRGIDAETDDTRAVVDAVVSVVLPAQVDALKAQLEAIKRESNGFCNANAEKLIQVDALKAENEQLRGTVAERDQLKLRVEALLGYLKTARVDIGALKARVGVLTDALSGLLDNSLTLALVAARDRARAALAGAPEVAGD